MPTKHLVISAERWQKLSLAEQMGNIGSEVHRALLWRNKDTKLFFGAIERGLELLDLTIADGRRRKGLKELTRVREFLCEAVWGRTQYRISLEDLDKYFFQFALAARLTK